MRLLQDTGDPFTHFVACVLLNRTSSKQVARVLPVLLARHGTPDAMVSADPGELAELLRPLGFFRSRAVRLIELAGDYARLGPSPELRGVGRYGWQSYEILFLGRRPEGVTDKALLLYLSHREASGHERVPL